MSKTTDQLAFVHCHNEANFAEHGHVYIHYRTQNNQQRISGAWQVICPGYSTDPDNPDPFDIGRKTFLVSGRSKDETLAEAKKWAGERYGITNWAKTPYGSWMDGNYVKNRLGALLEVARRRQETEGVPNDST